jgi:long-subunit fatty acid transport protein
MKKFLTLVATVCLVLGLGATVMADGKKVYLEYEKEKDVEDTGPTVGFDWSANDRWTLSLGYQFEGDGNDATISFGAEYAFNENLAVALNHDTADSEKSTGLELNGSYALSEPWALTGGFAYTAYSPKAEENLDYTELELAAGVEYQASEALLASVSYVWTDTVYSDATLDKVDGGSADKFVIGAEYGFGDYAVYLEYEIPKEGYTATVGVSYSF